MPKIVALYRYPVKGFAPEHCDALTVLPEGRIAGDRVLNFRFADAPAADDEWCRKYHGVVLANTPGLARLALRLDPERSRLRIVLDGRVLADEGLDAAGRGRIVEAFTQYVLSLDESPLRGHPERLPLKLVGDGVTARYQDNRAGQVTLHGRASLAALAASLGAPDLSELRFRSNVAIEGAAAWAEQSWCGRRLRMGGIEFDVTVPKTRCLATHANPLTGTRDLRMMPALLKAFPSTEPTFAVAMMPRGAGGVIRVGDEVGVLD